MSFFGGGLGGRVLGLVILSLLAVSRGNTVAPGRSIVPDREPPGVHGSDDHVWRHILPEACYCTIHHECWTDVVYGYAGVSFHYGGTGDNNPAKNVWDSEPQPETRESNTQVNPEPCPDDCQVPRHLTSGRLPLRGGGAGNGLVDSQMCKHVTFEKRPPCGGGDGGVFGRLMILVVIFASLSCSLAMESRPTTPPFIMNLEYVSNWGYQASNAFLSTGPHPSRANSPVGTRPPSPIVIVIVIILGFVLPNCDAALEVDVSHVFEFNVVNRSLLAGWVKLGSMLGQVTIRGLAAIATSLCAMPQMAVFSGPFWLLASSSFMSYCAYKMARWTYKEVSTRCSERMVWTFIAQTELGVGANVIDFVPTPLAGDSDVVDRFVHGEWRNRFCWRYNLARLLSNLGFDAEAILVASQSRVRRTRVDASRVLLHHRDTIFSIRAMVFNKLARETVRVDNAMNRAIVNREVLNVIRSMSAEGQPFARRDVDISRLIGVIVSACFIDTIYDEIGDEIAFGPAGRPL